MWVYFSLYKLLLDIVYFQYMPKYIYYVQKFVNSNTMDIFYPQSFSIYIYLLGWIVFFTVLLVMDTIFHKKISNYNAVDSILLFLICFSFIPGVSILGAGGLPLLYFLFFTAYWLIFILIANKCRIIKYQNYFSHDTLTKPKKYVFYSIFAIHVCTVIWMFYNYGTFFTSGITTNEVYSLRLLWREIQIPVILKYIMANTYIVLCVVLIYYLETKRYLQASIIVFLQYLNFCCGANKIILWGTFVCVFIYFCKNIISLKSIIVFMITILITGMILLDFNTSDIIINFIRRMMFLPNILSFEYYDYIVSNNNNVDNDISFKIGEIYFGNINDNANTGLIADALRMYGLLGVVMQPLLWGGYMCILNMASKKLPHMVLIISGIITANVIIESPISTSMLSHGGIAMIVMLYCMPRIYDNI